MAWIKYERRVFFSKDDHKRKHPKEVCLVYSNDTGPLSLYLLVYLDKFTRNLPRKVRWLRLNEGEQEEAIWYKDKNDEWDVELKFGNIVSREENWLMNLKR